MEQYCSSNTNNDSPLKRLPDFPANDIRVANHLPARLAFNSRWSGDQTAEARTLRTLLLCAFA